ncbi:MULTISPECIES: ATP-dependent helicase HrpB [unclassified Pseudonocardia]|uniref:ATP-dependent helicase HrpB n=1 Tax=unclassified Pseudonocardia TaxID=2619320 RepID=UPI00096602BF|nr:MULTISPECIES: ATP-dependent helicase HrpB [unclassified Pseudonocardia]MBN9097640.1 ATP-dependent helicase HrpB [Pseudonocardia sp.]OJY39952.1 MAG: ATP-dependent helicase HrpB [Pseudonocardia sp. 73-21]
MQLPADLPDLPVRAALDTVTGTLAAHGTAVLVAPPGTGKTTLVPLALAAALPGRVLVAEPRRLAARAAAARMASLLGEPVGRSVGYAVRGDRKVSAATRVEVVTSGLLLRRLAGDPELDGVSAVLLDECHERHLDADLLLALLLDARAGLRPDLQLLATSATVATGRLAEILGEAPVLEVSARTYPVEIRYAPPARGERIEACVARAVRTALDGGDVLVFLPGVAEIRRTANALSGLDADVLPLHGRLTAAEQDAALRPGPRRRVVLATAVAESSLTVPGVRAVVDAGLARTPRVDHRRGMAGLVTVRVSAAVADQRAGRAGREAPGRVIRCWPEGELLTRYPEPEIRTADLTRLALDLADWGTPDGSGLRWWDAPPEGPLHAGQEVLRALGALDADGITGRGRRMAGLGLHPRLARALLDGADAVGVRLAAEVVALLDDDTLSQGTEVSAELASLRGGSAPGAGRWRAETARLRRLCADNSVPAPIAAHDPAVPPKITARRTSPTRRGRPGADDHDHRTGDAAFVVALAQPERLARRRSLGSPLYLMAGGTAVELPAGSPLAAQEWLAVADAERSPGAQNGRVRLAAATDRETAEAAAPALLSDADEVVWANGDVLARHVRRLGAIVLEERPLARPDPRLVRAALVDGLREEGLDLLRWTPHARALRDRLATLHRVLGDPWPDVSDAALLADPDRWWTGPLTSARRRSDLARVDAGPVLRGLLDWRIAGRLDELAPERLEVPTGSRIALDYSGDQPVLAVRLQEVLGWTATPAVADGRLPVVLHLLSPAGRPAAVTADLASFWAGPYAQVRSELRGRYPKHDWPADPLTATPSRRPRRPPRP